MLLGFHQLNDRRQIAQQLFVAGLLTGNIDSPMLLQQLEPQRYHYAHVHCLRSPVVAPIMDQVILKQRGSMSFTHCWTLTYRYNNSKADCSVGVLKHNVILYLPASAIRDVSFIYKEQDSPRHFCQVNK